MASPSHRQESFLADDLIATPNTLCCLRNPANQKLLLLRPSRGISYDLESSWVMCSCSQNRLDEFLASEKLDGNKKVETLLLNWSLG